MKKEEGRRKKEEGRRKKEEGRRKEEEGRRKKEEGRRKKEEGRRKKEGRRKNEKGLCETCCPDGSRGQLFLHIWCPEWSPGGLCAQLPRKSPTSAKIGVKMDAKRRPMGLIGPTLAGWDATWEQL